MRTSPPWSGVEPGFPEHVARFWEFRMRARPVAPTWCVYFIHWSTGAVAIARAAPPGTTGLSKLRWPGMYVPFPGAHAFVSGLKRCLRSVASICTVKLESRSPNAVTAVGAVRFPPPFVFCLGQTTFLRPGPNFENLGSNPVFDLTCEKRTRSMGSPTKPIQIVSTSQNQGYNCTSTWVC